jgi:hypothetical protein
MKNLFLITIVTIFILSGCKKDEETTTNTHPTSFNSFLNKYATPSEIYTITAGRDTVIIGSKGTILNISQYSFYPIMTGNVKIELKEYFSRKDILLNNLQTISGNQLLATAGMIYLEFTQNSIPINNWGVQTTIPTQTIIPGMNIFYNTQQPGDSSVNWTLSDSSYVFYDTAQSYYSSYINSGNSYLWINYDYFVNQTPVTTVKATFTNTPSSVNPPYVYLVLDINAIAHMWFDSPNQGVFKITNIPEGLTGKIVAFTVVNGNYYFCKKPITVTTNLNASMTFQTVTELELITELENL